MFDSSLAPRAPTTQERLSVPNRWSNLNQSIKGFGDFQADQYRSGVGLQLAQAQQLANAQAMYMAYTGKRNPNIDSILQSNPFGRFIIGGQGLSSANGQNGQVGSPQPMNNQIAGTMFGLSPGQAMASSGNMPFAMGMPNAADNQATDGAPSTNEGQSDGGASMSPLSPGSNAPVTTSMTSEFQPYVGMMPKSVTTQNPAGEATVAGAKEYSSKMAGEVAGAQAGTAKDTQQLAMITNALKPLVQSYDEVYNSKAGGMPAAGDIYGSNLVKHADMLPRGLGIQDAVVSPDTQNSAGQFLANKNELVVKLQPLLSQQFGKDGSSRIMEKLVDMSQQEIGDLSTPRDQFHGQLKGTISSLYRIAKAAEAYKQDIMSSGQTPDPNTAASEITRRMAFQHLSPEETKELQGLIDDTIGQKSSSSKQKSGGSMSPFANANPVKAQSGVPTRPKGATHYSPSTGKFYDAQGNEINASSK